MFTLELRIFRHCFTLLIYHGSFSLLNNRLRTTSFYLKHTRPLAHNFTQTKRLSHFQYRYSFHHCFLFTIVDLNCLYGSRASFYLNEKKAPRKNASNFWTRSLLYWKRIWARCRLQTMYVAGITEQHPGQRILFSLVECSACPGVSGVFSSKAVSNITPCT